MKIFRKFRQKMLINNKFSKYLFYAVGEIILVVIGILIAFQIDNNKEMQKERFELNQYLREMTIGLETEIKFYDWRNDRYEENAEYLTKLQEEPYDSLDLSKFSLILRTNTNSINTTRTYTSLVELGKMNQIRDFELSKAIHQYYNTEVHKYNQITTYHKNMTHKIEYLTLMETKFDKSGNEDLDYTKKLLESGELNGVINFQIEMFTTISNIGKDNENSAEKLFKEINEYLKQYPNEN